MNTISECDAIIREYLAWLRAGLSVAEVREGICEITTPFVDRHNDSLQLYLFQKDGDYILTDDGYTLSNLEMSGVDLSSPKRQRILETILQGFGVSAVEGALTVRARRSNLPRRKHNLIQAMLAINDMFVMAREQVLSLFREDVEQFLRANEIRFTAMIKLAGRSGFDHTFDFVIPSSPKAPERLLRAINRPNRDTVSSYIFAWNDTREVRAEDTQAYAILNDDERRPSGDLLQALSAYQIQPVLWSQREQRVHALQI
ncbi:MAG: DUF1829 domain-containing protein [Anaerolineales bacterium]|nr:MAG: DUF1829 domain-containing protein [Anaerolineales bacterium]